MKIYTKTGDQGQTSLWGEAGEKRIAKNHLRVEAYGTVDEANACLGVARLNLDGELADQITHLQHRLFALGADLSTLNRKRQHHIQEEDVLWLETLIDRYEATLPPLRQFILPAGSAPSAFLHQARTMVRRAERRVVALYEKDPGPPEILRFLNRLSDLLFVLARQANFERGVADTFAEF